MKRFAVTMIAALVVVAGCSGGDVEHSAEDVAFAQSMIAHHEPAVQMATLAVAQAGSPRVKDLAGRIKGAQEQEIRAMKEWLTTWREPVVGSGPGVGGMGGMDDGGGQTSAGVQSSTEAHLTGLQALSGPQFDRTFLPMMVKYHEFAVRLARAELQVGKYEPARELARTTIEVQEKEIAEMQGLLAGGL